MSSKRCYLIIFIYYFYFYFNFFLEINKYINKVKKRLHDAITMLSCSPNQRHNTITGNTISLSRWKDSIMRVYVIESYSGISALMRQFLKIRMGIFGEKCRCKVLKTTRLLSFKNPLTYNNKCMAFYLFIYATANFIKIPIFRLIQRQIKTLQHLKAAQNCF